MGSTTTPLPVGLKATLVLTAVVLTVLGAGLTFANHWMAVLYGTAESVSGANASRTAGAAIMALGLLAWIGRRQEHKILRSVVVPTLFAWFCAKSAAAYLAVMDEAFRPAIGMTVFGFDVLLSVVYGYYLFVLILARDAHIAPASKASGSAF
jgi:hypothetical protein